MGFSHFIFTCVTSVHTSLSLEQSLSVGIISPGLEEQVCSQENERLTWHLRKLEKLTDKEFESLRGHLSLVKEYVYAAFEFLLEILSPFDRF